MALTKCINSESKQYKPVLVDKLILDDVPTVNSLNAITSDAVARAVAGASGEVPAVTENDNGKVLKAVYDAGGPAVEWGEAAPAVTVDQTYNALSENPQSGVAVAEAIAAIPTSSYTAGDGIKIDNGEVSVDYDANTIDAVAAQVTENVSTVVTGHHINFHIDDSQFEVPLEIQSWSNIYPTPTSTITMTIPANTFYYSGTISAGKDVVVTAFNTAFQLTTMCNLTSQPLTTTYDSAENKTWIDGQTVTFHYPLNTPEWSSPYGGKLKTIALGVFEYSTYTTIPFHTDSTTLANPIVFTYTSAAHTKIAVKNPLPASTSADENKVLTVNSSGNAVWQNAQGGGGSSPISMYSVAPTQYQLPVSNTNIAQITHNGFTLSWTAKPDITYTQMALYISNSSIQSAYVFCESRSSNNIKPVIGGTEDPNGTKVYTPQDMSTPLKTNSSDAYAGTEEYTKITVMYNDNSTVKSSTFTVLWSSSAVDLSSNTYALEAKVMVIDG